MADISKVNVAGVLYDIKDAFAREAVEKFGSAKYPLSLPFYVEKNGTRYKCDIADDDEGIDWVLIKVDSAENPMTLPLFMVKGDVTYIFDIADDALGIDWSIERKKEENNEG